MPQKNRRELYQRIRYDKNEYYPAVFVFVFFSQRSIYNRSADYR